MVLAMSEDGRPGDDQGDRREAEPARNIPRAAYATLRKAELVLATRGARGGYVLARPSSAMSLAVIVEALEGPIDIADCADVPNCCLDSNACALKDIFEEANQPASLRCLLRRFTRSRRLVERHAAARKAQTRRCISL